MEMCQRCERPFETLEDTVDGATCLECRETYYNPCAHCGEMHRTRFLEEAYGEDYCPDCFSEDYFICESCEMATHRDNMVGGYRCLCESCHEPGTLESLLEYDYRPTFKYYGKGPLYFGIELEIEFCEADPEILLEAADHRYFFLKHDGSISEGAEVVSHPASYDWIQEHFEETWKRVLGVRNEGMRSFDTSTCGIHIHLSRKAFTTLHLYKFLRFFKENQIFIYKISQRQKDNLSQWASLDESENIIEHSRNPQQGERYVAINLQNENSIELRIFRGNLKESGFRKNIEFCKALYDFTKNQSLSNLTAIHFKKFVHGKNFPNLWMHLRDLAVLEMRRVPTENGIVKIFPYEVEPNDWNLDSENTEKNWEPSEAPSNPVEAPSNPATELETALEQLTDSTVAELERPSPPMEQPVGPTAVVDSDEPERPSRFPSWTRLMPIPANIQNIVSELTDRTEDDPDF